MERAWTAYRSLQRAHLESFEKLGRLAPGFEAWPSLEPSFCWTIC